MPVEPIIEEEQLKLHEKKLAIGYGNTLQVYRVVDVDNLLQSILFRLSVTPVDMSVDAYEDLCLSIADDIHEHLGPYKEKQCQ